MDNNQRAFSHTGVLGMKWGHRKAQSPTGIARQTLKNDRKKALNRLDNSLVKLTKTGRQNDMPAIEKAAAKYDKDRALAKDKYKATRKALKDQKLKDKEAKKKISKGKGFFDELMDELVKDDRDFGERINDSRLEKKDPMAARRLRAARSASKSKDTFSQIAESYQSKRLKEENPEAYRTYQAEKFINDIFG